jgi:hypothetical protein
MNWVRFGLVLLCLTCAPSRAQADEETRRLGVVDALVVSLGGSVQRSNVTELNRALHEAGYTAFPGLGSGLALNFAALFDPVGFDLNLDGLYSSRDAVTGSDHLTLEEHTLSLGVAYRALSSESLFAGPRLGVSASDVTLEVPAKNSPIHAEDLAKLEGRKSLDLGVFFADLGVVSYVTWPLVRDARRQPRLSLALSSAVGYRLRVGQGIWGVEREGSDDLDSSPNIESGGPYARFTFGFAFSP